MTSLDNTHFIACRNYVKFRLLQPSPFLRDHENEKQQITNLFVRTVKNGESNSALLIGPRSCGKSTLVSEILKHLSEETYFQDYSVIVYLSGLVHTDDGLALKAIASQMGLGNVCEGRTFGSLAENLSFFLDCLKSGDRERTKSTIIVMDEFDLFCSRTIQTLLYNLFDVAQSAQSPICVLGITCRLDVVELLEKRVKSRFSNRHIFLFPRSDNVGTKGIIKLCEDLLNIPKDCPLNVQASVICRWNKEIKSLCNSQDFTNAIQELNWIDISESGLRAFLVSVISKLNMKCNSFTAIDMSEIRRHFMHDPKVNILCSLSVLELCLIIAMKHHNEIYDEEPFNFEMILRIYMKFIQQNSLDYTTERSVLMKAFENIVYLELITPVRSVNNSNLKEHHMYKLVLFPQQIKLGVQSYHNLPTEVQQWVKFSQQ